MQGIPRAHFDVVKDDLNSFETGDLTLPRCLLEEQKPLPCLTTPSDDPQGRPAPRSSKGKISSEANQRWRADRQRFAPWHYEAGVMMTDSQGRFVLPPPSVKEQWHHLPWNWTEHLPEHERHKALANGWHAGAARLIFIMAMFGATPPPQRARELNPLGGTALDIVLGPGPGDYFNLSYLEDPSERWSRSRLMPSRVCSLQLPPLRKICELFVARQQHLRRAHSGFPTTRSAGSGPWMEAQVRPSLRQPLGGHGRLLGEEPTVRVRQASKVQGRPTLETTS